MQKMKFYRR